jgi:outer membrane protein assembly factor BamA
MRGFVMIWCLLFGECPLLWGQTSTHSTLTMSAEKPAFIILDDIVIEGNQKTHSRIILRELDLRKGDTVLLTKADSILLRNRNKIFNTNLFVTVDLSIEKKTSGETLLKIKLQERWYIFPGPIFELSDRNFNEWWNTYNRDFSRTNYGIRLVVENVRGRNEKLDVLVQNGFTQKFSIGYNIPYIDRKQKNGIKIQVEYAQNKSVAYRTNDHKLSFVDSNAVLSEKMRASLAYTHRQAYYTFHTFRLQYQHTHIADTILKLNPQYFLNNQTQQQYFSFSYAFRRDVRDIVAYPLHGKVIDFEITKNGLGILSDIDQTSISLRYAHYLQLGKKFYLENMLKGNVSLQNYQPYANAQALGYQDNVLRGFELYVIDGQGYGLSRNTLRYQLFQSKAKLNFIPIRQFRTMPFAVYLTTFADVGYVRDMNFNEVSNRYSNKPIYGFGGGVDIFTFYNLVLKTTYAFNSDLKGGLYFSLNADL